MTRTLPAWFSKTPEGDLIASYGRKQSTRWDGMIASLATETGIPAPTTTPTVASSDGGAIVGTIHACVRYLDAAGRVSNISPISAAHTIAVSTKTISGATNAAPIVITATSHGLSNGDTVKIDGVVGNYAANGTFVIANVSTHTFSLNNSVGSGTYVAGGTARKGARDIDYSDIEDATGKTNVTRKQILRTKDGNANVFYVDMDTDVDVGFSLNSTTALSTKTEASLGTEVALLDDNGNDLNVTSHGRPPAWKRIAVHHFDRMFYFVDAPYREGAVAVTDLSATVTGIGTAFTSEMANWRFFPLGANNTVSYAISSINTSTQTITLADTYDGDTAAFIRYELRKVSDSDEPLKDQLTFLFSEAGLPYSVDAVKALSITEDPEAGEPTGLMAYRGFLYFLFENRIWRFSYTQRPEEDGQGVWDHWRGCLNQRCFVIVDGDAYLLDRQGMYSWGGMVRFEPIGLPLQSAFKRTDTGRIFTVRFENREYFHAAHDPQEETILWFVCLDGSRYPRHAFAYSYRHKRFWVEEYPFGITSSCVGTFEGRRTLFLGAEGRRVFIRGRNTLDGARLNGGTVRGTVTSAGLVSLTDSTAAFDSANLLGMPVRIVSGTGAGQGRLICAATTTKLTIKTPWSIKPDTTSVYQVGGFQWRYRTAWLEISRQHARECRLRFRPTDNAAHIELRVYEDSPDPELGGRTTAVVPGVDLTENGVTLTKGRAARVIDSTRVSGYVRHRLAAGGGSEDGDGACEMQLELRGVPNDERQRIEELRVSGAG